MKPNFRPTDLFRHPIAVSLLALTAAVAWGWAYPLIKLGFEAFAITPDMTAGKMLFAGIRFSLSGLIILGVARAARRPFALRKKTDGGFILLFALLNTTLHYAFFYIGLSHSQGARAAILNSLSVFAVVLLSCLFFKSERLTWQRAAGCVVGFAGILTLHAGKGGSGAFTWLGDGMIILNALCGALASLLTRGLGRRVDVFVGTGYSLALGGVLLLVPAMLMGAVLPRITPGGLAILTALVGISTIGFTLYNKLLTCNPVGKVAIYNSLIPVVGAVTSCLCLGEAFRIQYVVAGTLAAAGIFIIQKGKK